MQMKLSKCCNLMPATLARYSSCTSNHFFKMYTIFLLRLRPFIRSDCRTPEGTAWRERCCGRSALQCIFRCKQNFHNVYCFTNTHTEDGVWTSLIRIISRSTKPYTGRTRQGCEILLVGYNHCVKQAPILPLRTILRLHTNVNNANNSPSRRIKLYLGQ